MHSLFIVHLKAADWFDRQAEKLGNGGAALVRCLSADGSAPATQGWCGVPLGEEQAEAVKAILADHPDAAALVDWSEYDQADAPDWPDQRLEKLGLQRLKGDRP